MAEYNIHFMPVLLPDCMMLFIWLAAPKIPDNYSEQCRNY